MKIFAFTRYTTGLVAFLLALITAACRPASLPPNDNVGACKPAPHFSAAPAELSALSRPTPQWTVADNHPALSSPATADLNGDGVLDIVQGHGIDGGAEGTSGVHHTQEYVAAIDGASGTELWRVDGRDDLVGTATFVELTGDTTPDVVIGGRRADLVAINGATGNLLWSFYPNGGTTGEWFNFYTSQPIADQNHDGVADIFTANGGRIAEDGNSAHGYLFILSGADGSIIASSPVPGTRETYMSALVIPAQAKKGATILFGTGGETHGGSLWRASLSSLMAGALDSKAIYTSADRGLIAPPAIAHFNNDCIYDVVVQAFDGTITAIDGATDLVIWKKTNPGYESYTTPTLGYFVGDDAVPDVFTAASLGVWPFYESADYLVINGATGEITWRETHGIFAPSGTVAADLNSDGRDEIIFGDNDYANNRQQIYVLDTSRNQLHTLGDALPQTSMASPWIGDIDNDGLLDLLLTQSAYQQTGTYVLQRFALPFASPPAVSWGGYLGTQANGLLR